MTDLLPLLRELCEAFGPSGFEDEVLALVRRHAEPLADSVEETPLGNLVVRRAAAAQGRPTLLLDAHVDEVGLIVSHVEERGFLRFATLGSIDARVLPSQAVTVRAAGGARHTGVIGVLPPHVTQAADREKAFKVEDLFIDLGYDSRRAVEARGIDIGAPAIVEGPFRELGEGRILSRALDDRAGCAVALAVLAALRGRELPVNLVVSFSVEEEIGGLGAATLAGCRPDLAVVLEGTTGTDTPGVPPQRVVAALGAGPALTIADTQIVVPERVVRALRRTAEEASIPYQIKRPRFGGTNAKTIQTLGAGIPAGIVAVPCRYIHSNASVLALDDLRHMAALATRFVETAGGGLLA